MRYGFVIDQDRCIGCHACTVACKEEHNIPIGVFRTWVKYIEKGEFPNTSRHFGVMRCNHCDDAPCIEICPTVSLFRRSDGIVDFDPDRCIGCKSCMQACPYDAIYIDPASNTAAKCNFCAHRVELNLEPACVIVCPTQAIIAGDLDNPASKPSRMVAAQKVTSRKPHKGTEPKLFYVGIDGDLLEPAAPLQEENFFWSDRRPDSPRSDLPAGYSETRPGASRVVYDISHPAPWGWKIGSYIWTKSIAAGALLVEAFLMSAGYESGIAPLSFPAASLALLFVAITGILLIWDLKRPERFYFLFTKPNPHSWVVWGAYILLAYGLCSFIWTALVIQQGWVPPSLVVIGAIFAIATAGYTAFLFGQARGRDFWEGPVLVWQLIVHAFAAGSAILLLASAILGTGGRSAEILPRILLGSLLLSGVMVFCEFALVARGTDARRAIDFLTRGELRNEFWLGAIGLGIVVPAILILAGWGIALASILALGGLWLWESLFVRAGQAVALS
ncbi:MAG TPA: NrfD/PsrC family molybdoenzyme membrane anchor subunit [Candidatus Binataceae bacterium]